MNFVKKLLLPAFSSSCFSRNNHPVLKNLLKYSTMENVNESQQIDENIKVSKKNTRYFSRKRRTWEDGGDKTKKERIDTDEPFERVKRKKVAMLMGYSGVDYFGMQRNPGVKTIEEDLFSALLKLNYITEESYNQIQTIQFQRAARTDKGVSAARQLVSLKLPEEVDVESINKLLPDSIRVFGVCRVTKGFNSKTNCDARTYSYTMPTYAFEPNCVTMEDRKAYRISEQKTNEVNHVLSQFKGTKNFHNFTAKKDYQDPSTHRYMTSFQIEKVFTSSDMEFAVLQVKGQSFMLHQIRKMVGLTLAIVRGLTDIAYMNRAFRKEAVDVPTAPGLGLVLEKLHYDRYNSRYGKDGVHISLEWDDLEEIIDKFKHEHIYPTIIKTEIEENSMAYWLENKLILHKFDTRDEISKKDESPQKENDAKEDSS